MIRRVEPMNRFRAVISASFVMGFLIFLSLPIGAEDLRVLRVIETFDAFPVYGNGRQLSPITFWRWSEEEKRKAGDFSQLELASAPGVTGEALKISVRQALPRGLDFFALWSTGLDYLPPETTAIRMKARVASGRFTLSVGGPTAYFATSDVRAEPQVLEPSDEWQTVTFSLVSDLERNYRRPIFSSESPVIYYTRWIQEPMRLLIGVDSLGELWLDEIELIASGEGTDFPDYTEETVKLLAESDLSRAFTFATDDREFDLSHTPGKEPMRKPAILEGRGPLAARQRGLEEMSFIGIPTHCPEGTNAFRLTMKLEHAGTFEELAVDVLALVAPAGKFTWEQTKAAEPQPGGYDYCLSPQRTSGLSWGFYHARRAVRKGEVTTLVIPFTDFVCGHGSGELRERHQLQQPLAADEVMAVALVSPYRQRGADTNFTIEKIQAVSVLPPADGIGTSYPQVPDLSKIRLEMRPGDHGKQARQVRVP